MESRLSASATRLACNLCGCKSSTFEAIAARDRRGRPLRTVVCRECGLVRHWHVPTDEQLRTFYTHHYRQDYHGEVAPSARRVLRAWQNGKRIHSLLRDHLRPGMRVLEVGAGIGCTVKYFEQQGMRASGIEPHRGFQHFAVDQLRADVANRDLFDCTDIQNVDLVLLVHVIEHFRSPRAALDKIRSMLHVNGLLYMECPNLAAPFAVRGRMFHYAHIHNFTPITLNALAAAAGLEHVAWIHPTNHPNLAGIWRLSSSSPSVDYQGGYPSTLEALRRYSWLTYHMRTEYLVPRARKLASYARERMVARRFVQTLIEHCQQQTSPLSHQRRAA